jgi:hypothetical protein
LQTLFNKSPFADQGKIAPCNEVEDCEEVRTLQNLHEPLESLSENSLWLYREIGSAADCLAMQAYAVGGSVRDMLLGFQNFDLDFVIEGSAIAVAENLVKRHPNKFMIASKHDRFQTATLTIYPPLGKNFMNIQRHCQPLSHPYLKKMFFVVILPSIPWP